MEFFTLFFSNRQVFSRFYNFILLHILISIQRNIVHKKKINFGMKFLFISSLKFERKLQLNLR